MTVNIVVQPLLKEETNAVQLYASDSFLNSVKRRIEFLKTHPDTLIQIQNEAEFRRIQGSAYGLAVGGTIALACGTGPMGTVGFMIIGTVGGGALGYGAALVYRGIQLKHSNEYLRWEAEAIQQNVLPLFRDFLSKNEVIKNSLCPIGGDLITVPVRAEDGITYEQHEIEQWLDAKMPTPEAYAAMSPEQKALALTPAKLAAMTPEERELALLDTSPLRICYITKAGLEYDFEYHKKLFANLKIIYNNTLSTQFKKGLHSYSIAVQNERKQIVSTLINDLTTQYTLRELPEADFFKLTKEIRRKVQLPSFI